MIYLKFPSAGGNEEKITGTATITSNNIQSETVFDAKMEITGTVTVSNTGV